MVRPALELLAPDPQSPSELPGCLSVIVPVYNEVDHVDELIQAVQNSPVEKEIIVVDDGSTDGTREKLRSMDPGMVLVFHQSNYGKGAAIRTALRYARGEFVLIQDADLEYDPQDYPKLLAPIREERANVVYGMRPDRPERGLRYYLGAKFLTYLANLLYGCDIHDEATCYKVFRRTTLSRLELTCRRFEFCPEVTGKLSRAGEKIVEVPISYQPRMKDAGKKIRSSDGWIAIWTLLRLRFARRSRILAPAARSGPPFPVSFVQLAAEFRAADGSMSVSKSALIR
jgi:dolichol-phosphate mannosyltransferase